jgi:hypothetical protein
VIRLHIEEVWSLLEDKKLTLPQVRYRSGSRQHSWGGRKSTVHSVKSQRCLHLSKKFNYRDICKTDAKRIEFDAANKEERSLKMTKKPHID